ncbi:AraC family transcriptional regulator [Falsiroseomonas oryziterrae]|uniref:AraC family transcriptional regulator n=1 Tax=Falsiroseomonas oryziterrae TaxID=2911368 RepID=UPI001F35FF1B|nr:AraC family transcriptional regulator [Roseomonas sp. NPKOSM-4]
MEILSDVLRAIRLNGAIFFDVEATSPWVIESPPIEEIGRLVMPGAEHVIGFHALLAGSCWVEFADGPAPLRLDAGDVLILPSGVRHSLCSAPGMRSEPDLDVYQRPAERPLPFVLRKGGTGTDLAHFMCGYFGCDARPFNPLLDALPPVIHAARHATRAGWVAQLIEAALGESRALRSGREIVLARLSELLFVEVLRGHLETVPETTGGWLSGLRDRHVGAALRLIHARPAEDWTLDSLARAVGVSRSVLAERFTHHVHLPPMHYLGRWRLQLAARLLEQPGTNVAQVAEQVGYESEAAFSRAFKKLIGSPPGAWRRNRHAA